MTLLAQPVMLNKNDATLLQDFIIPRKRWTRDECRVLVEKGIWEGSEYELIAGDLVPKMGQNEPHLFGVTRFQFALATAFGYEFIRTSGPLALSEHSEPEPDVCVTRHPIEVYALSGTPTPREVRLVVEVSGTTLAKDLGFKARLYAQAEIPEYVVLDVVNRRLHVHRDPQNGEYQTVFRLDDTQVFTPVAAPQAAIAVATLLPPSPPQTTGDA